MQTAVKAALPPAGAGPSWPLWPLALLAGAVPLLATLLAWALSVQLQLVPACNPFFDGCVSISRAARHDLPNLLFRALMLPAATLQALVWLLAARWLRQQLGAGRGLRALAPLGVTAAVALMLYASFLGTEGPAYRLLRQYGTVLYFGFTCLCLLLVGSALQRLGSAGVLALASWQRLVLQGLAVTLVLLGLVNALVAAWAGAGDAALKGRFENLTEWWGALIFVLGFFALAAVWRRLGLRLQMVAQPPPGAGRAGP